MKNKKDTIIYLVFSLVLLFGLVLGVTYALTKYSSSTTNKVSTGSLSTKIVEVYEEPSSVYPGQNVDKVVNVKNTGSIDQLVRVKVEKKWGSSRDDDNNLVQTEDDKALSTDNIVINYDTTKWLDGGDGYYYYKGILSSNQTTDTALFDSFTVSTDTNNSYKNKIADIDITAEAVQTKGSAIVDLWGKNYSDLGLTIPADTSDTTPTIVTYVNPTTKFTFSDDGDLFANFKNLEPGETRSQNITVKNEYDNTQSIYLKAEASDKTGDDITLINKLIKEYLTVVVKNGSTTIYSGPVWGNLDSESDTMVNDILLGSFAKDATSNLNVSLSASKNIPNEYQNLIGDIIWTFTTYETDATLIVHHYIDGTTTKVPTNTTGTVDDEEYSKIIGDAYTTSQATNLSNNYMFKEVSAETDPATGTITKAETVVTYYYELKPSTITTHHYIKDVDGTYTTTSVPTNTTGTVSDNVQNLHYTDSYTTSVATNINGNYVLVETPTNASGTVSQDEIIVNYYYQIKPATVITHYYISGTDTSVPTNTTGTVSDNVQNLHYTDSYTTSAATNVSTNYEYVGIRDGSDSDSGTVSKDSYVVIYDYALKDATLTVCHYVDGTTTPVNDNNGDPIACVSSDTKYGSSYTSSAKTNGELSDGWSYKTLATSSDPANGTISKDQTTVIYYYTTTSAGYTQPTITKTVDSSVVTSDLQVVTYNVDYSSTLTSYLGDTTLTIVDTLPQTIDETNSLLNGGVYNSSNKTITWTFNYDDINTAVNGNYEIDKNFSYSVKYTAFDYDTKKMTNVVNSTLNLEATGQDITASDDVFFTIEVKGKLTVHHYLVGTTTKIAADEVSYDYILAPYTTNSANAVGYELVTTPENATGAYAVSDTEVIYYYSALKSITVTKEVSTSTINLENSNPTFVFKLVKDSGEVYYKNVEFDSVVSTKSVTFDSLPIGTYTLSEIVSNRYTYDSVKDVVGGVESNGSITFDLSTGTSYSATYVNDKSVNSDLTDGSNNTNTFNFTNVTLQSITVTYNGDPIAAGDAVDRNDIVVTANYSDSSTSVLANDVYMLDLQDDKVSSDATGTVTVNVSYRDLKNVVVGNSFTVTIE